jgi:hypothetical protein
MHHKGAGQRRTRRWRPGPEQFVVSQIIGTTTSGCAVHGSDGDGATIALES